MKLCLQYYNNNIPNEVIKKIIEVQCEITLLVKHHTKLAENDYKTLFFKMCGCYKDAQEVLMWCEIIHEAYEEATENYRNKDNK